MEKINSAVSIGISALIVICVIAAAGFGLYLGTTFGQHARSSSTLRLNSCDYVIPGPCLTGYNFTLSISYSADWKVTYEGYNSLCQSTCSNATFSSNPPTTTSGSFAGSGNSSRTIMVGGSSNGWTLCSQAQKLDSTNSTLVLSVGGAENETSSPYGVTSVCQEVQLV